MKAKYLWVLLPMVSAGGYDVVTEENTVEAIYWHEHNRYSAAILNGSTLDMHRIPYHHIGSVTVFTDLESGKKPWYKCQWKENGFSGKHDSNCEIHIKDVDSLRTADWNHGKFGTGTTSRID